MDQKAKEKFLRTYHNLPLKVREEVILVLEEKGPITWNVAYIEIQNETKLGEMILKKLEKLKFI